jgi:hypothetical protein
MTAGARVPVKDRTQSARHRVDQPRIRGRTCANLGDYKPLYVLGAVYVLTIFYLPTGLMGIPERIRQRRALLANRENSKELSSASATS